MNKTIRLALFFLTFSGLMASVVYAQSEDALHARYKGMLDSLRSDLSSRIPSTADEAEAMQFITSDRIDSRLVKFVVLNEATPAGLAAWGKGGKANVAMIEKLLADEDLMKQMIVADVASRIERGKGPAQ